MDGFYKSKLPQLLLQLQKHVMVVVVIETEKDFLCTVFHTAHNLELVRRVLTNNKQEANKYSVRNILDCSKTIQVILVKLSFIVLTTISEPYSETRNDYVKLSSDTCQLNKSNKL